MIQYKFVLTIVTIFYIITVSGQYGFSYETHIRRNNFRSNPRRIHVEDDVENYIKFNLHTRRNSQPMKLLPGSPNTLMKRMIPQQIKKTIHGYLENARSELMRQISGLYGLVNGTHLWRNNIASNPQKNHIPSNLRSDTTKDDMTKKVKFYLQTRKNSQPMQLIPESPSALLRQMINLPIKIIIHGYLESSKSATSERMRQKFLQELDVATIKADWGKLSRYPIYWPVQKNVELVGKYVARLVDWLISEGADPSNIHIIGHSLGAHVAGFAGAFTSKGKVGRITGLDPALPGYDGVGPELRLDPTDAEFVDVIHTCDGLYGYPNRAGHADFFVNGGRHQQPGCTKLDLGVCSHIRSADYFTESIESTHKFEAALCNEIPRSGPSSCKYSKYLMGYHLDKSARGIFYVQTRDKSPFAIKIAK